ncbi:hypothetical protein AGOR_G00197100 [Albula goreensis]|uniref:Uncharacterized protein n=1 Tax=Albula goreensis TaxID=1534307 RepID=A0A8T3CTG2_9TELE|nr:hypothetical protein AGOR_G00197100 [Albula goreensis]
MKYFISAVVIKHETKTSRFPGRLSNLIRTVLQAELIEDSSSPAQPSTAGAPGTDPEVDRSAEGQTGSWATAHVEKKADELARLWTALPHGDKLCLLYPSHHQDRLMKARFQATFPLRSEVIKRHW